jgi:bis(5'-nucleosyl)-tetraphosphatase (symmetrical)
MTCYAIGDLQGCYGSFMQLLEKINFDDKKDQLWLAGDLVNRGENSLAILRFLKSLDNSVSCVLGNHDISLIAMHYGLYKCHPSLKNIMKAPDREELINWIESQPMIQIDKKNKVCMTHAGLPPKWKVSEALTYSQEIEQQLQGNNTADWLSHVYEDKPKKWKKSLQGYDRDRYILNAFTRMRFINTKGSLNFKQKHSPLSKKHKKEFQDKLTPWFSFPDRKSANYRLLFGHWASLGFYQANNVIGLDTGCVWGASLSAINMDIISDEVQPISVSCHRKKSGKET